LRGVVRKCSQLQRENLQLDFTGRRRASAGFANGWRVQPMPLEDNFGRTTAAIRERNKLTLLSFI
jgi:hypothetical protein